MTSPGLKVRCLASTRFLQGDGRDQVQEEQDEGRPGVGISQGSENDENQQGESLSETSEKDRLSTSSPSATSSPVSDTDSSNRQSSPETSEQNQTQIRGHLSCVQDVQLSPDGTCIFTSDYSRTFSVYPIDTDILYNEDTRPLRPYASFISPNPIWDFAVSPLFNSQDASSTHVLVSRRDSYITLHNALWGLTCSQDASAAQSSSLAPVNIFTPIMSYKLIDHLTEAVTAPLSLAYSHDSAHFFAGKQNGIATFDLEHSENPVHIIKTIPSKRNKLKGGGRGFKGWISALSLSPPSATCQGGVLAAGARTRYVGIYDAVGGLEVTHFSLPGTVDGKKFRSAKLQEIMGDGVSNLKWSPCGRYLYVAERQSDALLIYDVRNFSLSLGYCVGRRALTKQKLGFDVWNAGASPYDIEGISHEIWAGGTDGHVRVWKDPYMKEGAVEADEAIRVNDESLPVVGTLVHPSGSLAVAASGMLDIGGETGSGIARGGGVRPRFKEQGIVDILGLQ